MSTIEVHYRIFRASGRDESYGRWTALNSRATLLRVPAYLGDRQYHPFLATNLAWQPHQSLLHHCGLSHHGAAEPAYSSHRHAEHQSDHRAVVAVVSSQPAALRPAISELVSST